MIVALYFWPFYWNYEGVIVTYLSLWEQLHEHPNNIWSHISAFFAKILHFLEWMKTYSALFLSCPCLVFFFRTLPFPGLLSIKSVSLVYSLSRPNRFEAMSNLKAKEGRKEPYSLFWTKLRWTERKRCTHAYQCVTNNFRKLRKVNARKVCFKTFLSIVLRIEKYKYVVWINFVYIHF